MKRAISVVLCIVGVLACTREGGDGLLEQAMRGETRVVDLSYQLHENIPVFPGGVPFHLRQVAGYDNGYYANALELGEHTGTHMDAPAHFVEGEPTAHEFPPHTLIASAIVVDVREKVAADPDYRLTEADLDTWEGAHGRIPARSLVIMRTGWGERWETPDSYINADAAQVMHFPGFGLDAARMADARNVLGIGVDTLSGDYGPSTDFAVHRYLSSRRKVILENLANLDALPPRGAVVIIGVLPVRGGSGGPARVVALVPPS